MQEIREGKEGYGDPSGEATEEARPRISRQTAWSARSAAQGALRWHHTARGLCSSWRRITEKRAGSPRARTCPETEAADGHGYRALLWPATLNLVACLYMRGCFQTMLRQAGLSPATRSSLPQAVRSTTKSASAVGRRLPLGRGNRLCVRRGCGAKAMAAALRDDRCDSSAADTTTAWGTSARFQAAKMSSTPAAPQFAQLLAIGRTWWFFSSNDGDSRISAMAKLSGMSGRHGRRVQLETASRWKRTNLPSADAQSTSRANCSMRDSNASRRDSSPKLRE